MKEYGLEATEGVSMDRTTQKWGVGGLLIVVVALIVGAALPGRTTTSTGDDPLPTNWNEQLTSETALVAAKHATGGLKIAGIRLDEKTYRLDLHFLGSPECTVGVCAGPDELVGEVVGLTTEGNRIVNASIEVSRECYHLIQTTDPWPSFPECVAILSD